MTATSSPSPTAPVQVLREKILSASGPFTPATIVSLLAAEMRQRWPETLLRSLSDLDGLTEEQALFAQELLPTFTGASLPREELATLALRRRAANK